MKYARWSLVAVGVLLAVAATSLAANQAANNYIGGQRCKVCHEFEYQVWQRGPHASAHKSLTAEQLRDPKCSGCHTMAPDLLDQRFLGIQCERCHGPGKYYRADYVMKDKELSRAVGLADVTEADCKQCHTDDTPNITPFDFATMWAEIDHSAKARLAWQKSQEKGGE